MNPHPDPNAIDLEALFETIEADEEDVEDVEMHEDGALAQKLKVKGPGDAKGKKGTVIKKPSGPNDTGGKKKRVLPKTGGGGDTRKKRKA